MTKHTCLCLGLFIILCLSSGCTSSQSVRTPNPGVELSQIPGISLIRVSNPSDKGHGRFELNAQDQYELETFSLDSISLIELIAPNYRVSVRTEMPVGRYDFFVDCKLFPSENPIMQRTVIQEASFKEIQRAFNIKIHMDIAKRSIIVSK